jgi:hypothetical protein
MTDYCFTEVYVLPGKALYLDGNSKITAGNGTYAEPVPNALSLPHIATCPGSTEVCRSSCYVHGLQKHAPEVYAKYQQNERVIHSLLMDPLGAEVAAYNLATWIKQSCPEGFRWHVSGDVFSKQYAGWIQMVAAKSAPVLHWIYTRSLDLVPDLKDPQIHNLVVNVSTDRDTYPEARKVALTEGVRLCYLTQDGTLPDDLPSGSVIFPDYAVRGRSLPEPTTHAWWQGLSQDHRKMVCPADFFGQSEQHRCGVCRKCMA